MRHESFDGLPAQIIDYSLARNTMLLAPMLAFSTRFSASFELGSWANLQAGTGTVSTKRSSKSCTGRLKRWSRRFGGSFQFFLWMESRPPCWGGGHHTRLRRFHGLRPWAVFFPDLWMVGNIPFLTAVQHQEVPLDRNTSLRHATYWLIVIVNRTDGWAWSAREERGLCGAVRSLGKRVFFVRGVLYLW